MNTTHTARNIVLIVVGVFVGLCLISGLCGMGFGASTLANAYRNGTIGWDNPAPVATVAEEPVAEKPEPVAEAPAAPVIDIPCDHIQVSTDGGNTWQDAGEILKNESKYQIGDRTTWTARKTLIPDKTWDTPLTPDELKIVEQTWLDIRFRVCKSFKAVVFTGGINLGDGEYVFDEGALFDFGEGTHVMRIRNGEIVLWADEDHMVKDIQGTDGLNEKEEGRLIHEIRHGNFDIKSRLSLAVSDALIKYLPDDIARGVQVVILPSTY